MRTSHLTRSIAVAAGLLLAATSAPPTLAVALPQAPNCQVLPPSNVWNRRVDRLPVRADSDVLTASIGVDRPLHPDFSSIDGGGYGIPYNVVGRNAATHTVKFTWPAESDAGPYPIPAEPTVAGGAPCPEALRHDPG